MKSKSAIGPYILIGLGIFFLVSDLGWWPYILIIVGILLLAKRSSGGKQ